MTSTVTFGDGELVLSPAVRIRDDEILFIVQQQQQYQVCWLRETSDDAEHPFAFSTASLDQSALQALPDEVLKRHLLTDVPPVFRDAALSPSLHVVVSTGSGLGKAQAFYDSVLEPLLGVFDLKAATESADGAAAASLEAGEKGQKTYNLLVTSSSRSVTEFAHTLAKASPTATDTPAATIVLLSGDGGVVDLLNGVAEPDAAADPRQLPAIALLPLGTGNALFHSLHKPDYAAAAEAAAASSSPTSGGPSPYVLGLRTLFRGRAAPLPNFLAKFSPGSHTVSYALQEEGDDGGEKASSLKEQGEKIDRLRGAIVASYGFHAQLVWESDTPEYRKHGAKRFGMAAQELLKAPHAYNADVTLVAAGGGGSSTLAYSVGRSASYVLATLVSNLEKTFTISPASRPLDGQLRLVRFGAVGGAKTMEIMMAAYNDGAHVGMRWPREANADAEAGTEAGPHGGDDEQEESVGYDAIDELEVSVLEQDPRWRKVCIDGTIVEIPYGGWMRVRKAAKPVLQIIVNT